MVRWILGLTGILILVQCTPVQTGKKTDQEFEKALAESEKNKQEKLDFLKDEKLPNEEYVVTDSTAVVDSTGEFSEIPPTLPAKYRIQIFAGSAVNAYKTYNQYVNQQNSTEAYVIRDPVSEKWKVWAGNYQTKNTADSAKVYLHQNGYPDAWVSEMPAQQVLTKENRSDLFWVQMGSFKNQSAAISLQQTLGFKFKEKVIIKAVSDIYKVWIGGFMDRQAAEQLKGKLTGEGHKGVFIVQGLE